MKSTIVDRENSTVYLLNGIIFVPHREFMMDESTYSGRYVGPGFDKSGITYTENDLESAGAKVSSYPLRFK
jgi:hypothetical protein